MFPVTIKTVIFSFAALVVGIVGIGYATAWVSLDACAEEAFQEAKQRKISGYAFGGKRVHLTRADMFSEITGPFEVTVWFSLPRDLHATSYSKTFRVYPWARHAGQLQVLYLVLSVRSVRWETAG